MLLCIIPKNNVTQAKENATLTVSSTITKNDKAVIDIDLSGNSGIWACLLYTSDAADEL